LSSSGVDGKLAFGPFTVGIAHDLDGHYAGDVMVGKTVFEGSPYHMFPVPVKRPQSGIDGCGAVHPGRYNDAVPEADRNATVLVSVTDALNNIQPVLVVGIDLVHHAQYLMGRVTREEGVALGRAIAFSGFVKDQPVTRERSHTDPPHRRDPGGKPGQ